MKQHSHILVPVITLMVIVLACSVPSAAPPTAAPVPTEPQDPPFVGLWMSESETLVFTSKNLYRIQSDSATAQVNEQFAEIILHDPQNSHITLQVQWAKVNGLSVGFDFPIYSLLYKVDGDVLQIGLGTGAEFTTELSPTIYYRK